MWRDRASDDAGSALLLMPAGVLVVLVLGAMCVDAAVGFLGERELADLTAAAANDVATAALDEDAFYRCGRLRLDPARAADVAAAVARARSSDAARLQGLQVEVRNDVQPPQVTVAASGAVRLVFTPALPGSARTRAVAARSTAAPHEQGPAVAGRPECVGDGDG